MRKQDRLTLASILALAVHAGIALGLAIADHYIDDDDDDNAPVEFEFFEPPPPPPVAIPEPVLPESEPEVPEPEVPEPPVHKVVEPEPAKPRPPRTPPAPRRTSPEPLTRAVTTTEALAPGENVNDDDMAPKRVYRLPDQGPGGTIPVARGRTTGSARGVPGGTGTNTGGGGDPASTGTGVAPPRPVSVAAIAVPAKPIGDYDFIGGYKDYPAEARRLNIEGAVKVRLVVDAAGKVVSKRVVKGLGHGLDERALGLAAKLRFEPAKDTDGNAVRSVVVWTFRFTIPH